MRWDDDARRRRLVWRHHLGQTAASPEDVVAAVSALHSSDPLTPYLACWARIDGFDITDLEEALYERRTLVRMHSVRRTLFVVPVSDIGVFEAAAARDIARKELARLIGWLEPNMEPERAHSWLAELGRHVERVLEDRELGVKELTKLVPDLATPIVVGSGRWKTTVPLSSRLLFLMAMEGRVIRGRPAGTWRSSQYRWARMVDWTGLEPVRLEEPVARVEMARRYISTHGPVTLGDLRWWTGWTLAQTRRALSELDLVRVDLDGGEDGYLLSGDVAAPPDSSLAVTFLPALDPTVMGWKERVWYLGPHAKDLFDTNGNAGPTIWVSGRIVGGWGQDDQGRVVHRLLEDVSSGAVREIETVAARLGEWLGGMVVMPRFPSPLGRRIATGE
ncbi:MAG: winged helix DNA-binding domain-containing protein [Actinobacteria bacterium]|nr:winged helix DNA-binding domain-containing protein [Actinomycetota bacterium]